MRFTAEDIANWSDPSVEPAMSKDDAVHAFNALLPRVRFLKTRPLGASILDVGAGEGSSSVYKIWPAPARPDLRLYAWSGMKGGMFEAFDGYEIGWWPEQPPAFGNIQFDAIFSANFLEHIADPLDFVRWAAGRLKTGGSLYLEWPTPGSAWLPHVGELMVAGVDVMTGRYDDDPTHVENMPRLADVASVLAASGLLIGEAGPVAVPFVDQQLAIHARRSFDQVSMTLAYWSRTAWCHYLVANKV